MTRRIVVAILLVTWAVMLAGAIAVYMVTRHALLAELDDSLRARASALPQVLGVAPAAGAGAAAIPSEDRYVIRNELGQTVARPQLRPSSGNAPEVLGKHFVTLGDGKRLRSITIRMTGHDESGKQTAYTVAYSGSAERFDQLLYRLAWLLAAVCIVSALLAPVVAVRTSRTALRPLKETTEVIGRIDDRTLDQRIDVNALPSELRPVAERLNQMLERLERGVMQRKRFLADAAHELRTPIAAVLTSLEVALSRPRDAPALTRIVNDSLGDVRLLKHLAEALLDQARADHELKQHAAELLDVADLCDQCRRLLEPLAQTKGLTLSCTPSAEMTACAQPQRLRSILMNLMSNAIEHTPPGGHVELAASKSADTLTLSVADTGKGIAPEHLPHVFEPFYRVDDARTSHSGHLGLGLFLVRTHAEAMGGRCTVHTELGRGTIFTVILPQPHEAIRTQPRPPRKENVTA